MRLLNTTTLELHEFFGPQIPFYAILSHRWGDDEVTFQDLKSEGRVHMAGWTKITGCCAQAKKDGWEYAIDSCCIDKCSSAELLEAINSMFAWYKNAQVCYAYLSDVPVTELDHEKEDSAFRKSKWWTRGWTLQELIAPGTIIFFNYNWREIGAKGGCYELISSITNIESKFLWAYDAASVAQKMSWASIRDTLRVEDIAYCLMGLFGVNMPLLYGEGSEAFMRLQLEIIKLSDDESLFAWANENSRPLSSGLLANTPAAFRLSHNIEKSFSPRHEPYLMTNKGLQITLPLYQIERKGGPSLPPPPPEGHINYYLALLNCHSNCTNDPVVVRLRGTVSNGRETYVRIDCNKLDFDFGKAKKRLSVNIPHYNRRIFVSQQSLDSGIHLLLLNQQVLAIEVHAAPLLDHGFFIRTGCCRDLKKPVLGEPICGRKWMFHLYSSLYDGNVQSIAVQKPTAMFSLNVTLFHFRWLGEPYLSIDLSPEQCYVPPLLSLASELPGPYTRPRRDRAALMLPFGDIVSATLKKTSRGGGIVHILNFEYVPSKA